MVFRRIRIEWAGADLLALDPSAGRVHRISAADVGELRAGRWEPYERSLAPEVLDAVLAALGRPRWDRRRILNATGALAGAGITTLLLPSAAEAASLFGVAFGTGYTTGTTTFVASDGTGMTDASVSYLTWQVPVGISEVQVVAWGTSGGVARQVGKGDSPNSGTPGRGVYAVGSFTVTAGQNLVIAFSDARQSTTSYGGGTGGQAVGVGDLSGGSTGDWLIVAGGGGGGGEAGYNVNSGGFYYTDATYAGGDGGDAGIGGSAGAGSAGTGTRGTTAGGGGGTLAAGGAESAGATAVAGDGGSNTGPTSSSTTTSLGLGGVRPSTESSGGAGGGGYFGGGGAGNGTNGTACGGGGGGSSYLNTGKRAGGTQSRIELFNRPVTSFAKVDLYW